MQVGWEFQAGAHAGLTSLNLGPRGSWGRGCYPADPHCTPFRLKPLHSQMVRSTLRALGSLGKEQGDEHTSSSPRTEPRMLSSDPAPAGDSPALSQPEPQMPAAHPESHLPAQSGMNTHSSHLCVFCVSTGFVQHVFLTPHNPGELYHRPFYT